MAETHFCSKCGAELPAGAQFCPKCGTAAGAPAVPPAPISPQTYWIWVPVAVVALAFIGWVVLSGMPFRRGPRGPVHPPMEVVTEAESPATGTVTMIGEAERTDPPPPHYEDTPAVHEMTESQAVAALRRYIVASGTLSDECASVSVTEYKNRGYTLDVHDRCDDESLGRWRVDSEDPTGRGIFRQRADGRYLRP